MAGPGPAEGGSTPRVPGRGGRGGWVLVAWAPPPMRPHPSLTPPPVSPAGSRQVRDLWLPVPTARVAQLAHEEAHSRGAVQLHVRALWEALREAGQRQVPHAQKPPGPQASLTHPTTDRPYLFIRSDTTPGLAGARTAAGASWTAGRKEAPLPCPRAGPPSPGAGPPPTPPYLEVAPGTALLELCQESRARLKSEKGDALPLGLDDLGGRAPLCLHPGPFLSKVKAGGGVPTCRTLPFPSQPLRCLSSLGLAAPNTPCRRPRVGRLGAREATGHLPRLRILMPAPKSLTEHAFPTVRELRDRLGRCSVDP